MNLRFPSFFRIIVCFCLIGSSSCFKREYQGPPDTLSYDPQLKVTHTIAQLLTMPQGAAITNDITICGVVVMDDRSGNYYKSIVVQDSTAGIELLLDQSNLYNDYPVGRKIYVKCKGLFLGNYNGNPQLGYTPAASGSLSNIPAILMSNYIVKANYPNAIVPDTFTITELAAATATRLNTLVAIRKTEFADDNVGIPYAEQAGLSSATSLTIQDCSGSKAKLRTSGYAKFQPYLTPVGNGTMVGVFTKYKTDIQLVIRDTNDVDFRGVRCSGGAPQHTIFEDVFTNLNNWNAVSESGAEVWGIVQFGNPKPCAMISGYSGGNHANEDWLISKPINLAGYNTFTLTFETAAKYYGNILSAYISANYAGSGSPAAATWTPLTGAVFADVSGNFTFIQSGNIDLSSFKNQQIFLAFKYTSTTSAASSWELDNVKIKGQ